MTAFILGVFVGAFCGVTIMACFAVGKAYDEVFKPKPPANGAHCCWTSMERCP